MISKVEARKAGICARRVLSPESRKRYSEEIVRRITESPIFCGAKNILIYAARKEEVDLSSILLLTESRSKIFFYPRVDGNDMLALAPDSPEAWSKGSFGIMEPDPSLSMQIAPEFLDLVICPCTAFDESCARSGMGGGYYDRFLPRCTNAAFIAVAFDCQKADHIICEDTDIYMDAVYTEKAVYPAKQ